MAFGANGEAIVGRKAAEKFDDWIYDTKRFIGRNFNDPETQDLIRKSKFTIVEG